MLHSFGKVTRQDRINSLLITETAANLKTILDILAMVDQPTELNVETRIYQIKHAKASDIAARLNELAGESGNKEEVARVAQTPPTIARRVPDMTRARRPMPAEERPATDAAGLAAEMAEKGIIRGKVKILTDERTNIIIVISNPLNFTFFDQIVNVLDVEVDAEVTVEVVNLEFADAEEMASLLNDFIGAAKDENNVPSASAGTGGSGDERSRALRDVAEARARAADRVRAAGVDTSAAKIGQLSSNTKIMADTRTNTILLMGTKSDIAALQEVIKKVDIMLAQVLIEAVILEVNLNNSTSYGIDWLQKSMTAYTQKAAGNGMSVRTPVVSWGGSFGNNTFGTTAGDNVSRAFAGGTGLTYLFSFADLNIDAVLKMMASSGEGRVLATPVVLTTDNTEASIMSGQQVPIRTGDTTSSGGTYYSDYEYKDVGIQLKVKPRINPSRYVTLEITQAADTLGDPVDVGNGNTMYSINKREMTASISVPSRSTIVLGGLVQTDYTASNSRVPILGSIPLIGSLFRSEDKTRKRTELLVLITPYVLMTPDEAREETERLHAASNVSAEDWYRGWSDSSLAPFSPKEQKKRAAEKKAALLREKRKEQWRAAEARMDGEAAAAAAAVPANKVTVDEPQGLPVAVLEEGADLPFGDEGQGKEEFARNMERLMNAEVVEGEDGETELGAASAAPSMPVPGEETAPFEMDALKASEEAASAPAPTAVEPAVEQEEEPRAPMRRSALFGGRRKKLSAPDPRPEMHAAPRDDGTEGE